jgi:hypothetical protein
MIHDFNNFYAFLLGRNIVETSWFDFYPLNGNLANAEQNKENLKRFTKCPVETLMFLIVAHFWLSFPKNESDEKKRKQ